MAFFHQQVVGGALDVPVLPAFTGSVALPAAALRMRRPPVTPPSTSASADSIASAASTTASGSSSSSFLRQSPGTIPSHAAWPAMSPHAVAGATWPGPAPAMTAAGAAQGGSAATTSAVTVQASASRVKETQEQAETSAVADASLASKRPPSKRHCSRQTCDSSSHWVDPSDCSALCYLILDDRRGGGQGQGPPATRRRPLPPALYAEIVAPFLRFDKPLPNMLYAFGGRNQSRGPMSMVEMFDTWHGRWVRCPPMPARRAGSAAALLPDGRMVVMGGYGEKGIAEGLLASCDVYDPVQRKWELAGAMAPLLRARWGHGCATLRGRVYAVGGCSLQPHAQPREAFMETLRSCEVYDPSQNSWAPCASLQIPRSGSRVMALAGERYLAAIGGCDDVFGRAETQPTVELYDVLSGQWSLLARRLAQPRTTAAAVAIGDQDIFIVGGAPSLSSAERYHVSLPQASAENDAHTEEEEQALELAAMDDIIEGRMGCQAALVNLPSPGVTYPMSDRPSVVVVGGERCDEIEGDFPRIKQFKSVPVLDVSIGTWRADMVVPDMSVSRTAVALCVGMGHAAGY
mmetsp:Transcript_29983/g.75588  ORF Transcript_29983/g.75588 Transcript_29983/m.75588 type:complete len:575 (-) Transcript_29983:67-1791(-)